MFQTRPAFLNVALLHMEIFVSTSTAFWTFLVTNLVRFGDEKGIIVNYNIITVEPLIQDTPEIRTPR